MSGRARPPCEFGRGTAPFALLGLSTRAHSPDPLAEPGLADTAQFHGPGSAASRHKGSPAKRIGRMLVYPGPRNGRSRKVESTPREPSMAGLLDVADFAFQPRESPK